MDDNKKKHNAESASAKKSDRTEFADEINMNTSNKSNNSNK